MMTQTIPMLKRCAAGLLLVAGLGGCAVYAPPYAGNDPYYGGAGYSGYYGPPVSVGVGLGFYGNDRDGYHRRDGRGHGRGHHHDGRGRHRR